MNALTALEAGLSDYQPFHPAEADSERRLERFAATRLSYQRAIDLSENESGKEFLRNRMASMGAQS